MADPRTMLSIIGTYRSELEQALGADAEPFFAEVTKLQMRLQRGAGDPAREAAVADALLALIARFAAAANLLGLVAPAVFRAGATAAADEVSGTGTGALPSISFLLPTPPLTGGGGITRSVDLHNLDPSAVLEHLARAEPGGAEPTAAPEAAPALAAATVARYADVQAPASVAPDQAFTLSVALTRQPPADHPQAAPLAVRITDTDAGATGAPPVSVLVYATAFQLDGAANAPLHVYPDKDSETARFTLRPKPGIRGEQQISVTFIQGGINIVGRVVVKVQVGVQGAGAVSYSMPVGVSGAPGPGAVAEPDVILWVDRIVQNGRDYLHFRYMWPQQGQRDPEEVEPPVELNQVEGYAQQLYALLSKGAAFRPPPGAATDPGVQSAVAAAERELRKIGANLYEELFPQRLKDFYKQFAPAARSILIYSTEPWIPWEIVLPNDPDLAAGDCDFLCARFEVARWLIMDQETPATPRGVPPAIRVHEVCPIIPVVGLSAAQDERGYLGALPQTWPPLALVAPLPRSASEVLAVMAGGQVNLFHVATHGQFAAGNPGESVILFNADGSDRLAPDDLFEPAVRTGLTRGAPFVFVNACHSGRQGLALAGLGGWVDKLLRYGCSGFLGGNWEVQDDLAAQFAIAFYEGLHAGQTFGEACLAARQKIRAANPGNSTWLAYVLYAHPHGRLTVE